MAHTAQAKKRVRQNAVRNEANTALKSEVRTYMKNVDKAIEAGDKAAIAANFKLAMAGLHKAVSKNVFKKGFADRNISRMAKAIKKANA
tara:strand:- start:190 stop:456 length:267 start_codon:yes stop_codon:yes gene_type:complete